MEGGILVEARARQTLNSEWDPIHPPPIDGVYVRDVKNVVYRGGLLTELYRLSGLRTSSRWATWFTSHSCPDW